MMDPERLLEPLQNAPHLSERLREYDSAEALAAAVQDAAAAVERSLRLLLRSDRGVSDAERVRALSRQDLSFEDLIRRLRERGLISIELAGQAHELHAAGVRARDGDVRAADADRAMAAVERLRREVLALEDAPVRAAAHHTIAAHSLAGQHRPVPPPARRRRPSVVALLAATLVVVVVTSVWLLLRPEGQDAGMKAFAAGRYAEAVEHFEEAADRRPADVTVRLYLGRSYRRLGRLPESADVLRQAARLAPDDAAVRRELGHLFMELGRPGSALTQYEQAVELEPEATAAWVGLIRAMRAVGHPDVRRTFERAPPAVRALLGTRIDTTIAGT